ncbi:MAG: TatD family hydrolase [Nanoarchaeota archaeon]|nr:TatD family hydrolase [Nanoarchaeota archaeon]MBU1321596.1 TatD family hydrolase [Nanoarchaeota archaeon]MBU1598010.1 TatD family hydrolase [Nanoarchaeota archaeon]MBU2440960.1 TatD family hydrolase [Nanoarchaeota archaeon]
MIIVDIHAHMDFKEYDEDLDKVIEENKKAGVAAIINQGVDVASNRKVLELAKKYDIIKPALGFYPVHAVEVKPDVFDAEINFISKQDIVAIGEVGLDYKKGDDNPFGDKYRNEMRACFEKFIALAEKKKIPIIVHSRKAELDVIEMLESSSLKKQQIIVHAFMGRKHLVDRILDNGWNLSVLAIVNKLQQVQEIVAKAPMNQLLTETDCPYMTPYPDIKRNEPRFIIEALKKIAEIKKLDIEEVSKMIYQNYQKIF